MKVWQLAMKLIKQNGLMGEISVVDVVSILNEIQTESLVQLTEQTNATVVLQRAQQITDGRRVDMSSAGSPIPNPDEIRTALKETLNTDDVLELGSLRFVRKEQ